MEINPKKMDFGKMKSSENLNGKISANQAKKIDSVNNGEKYNPASSFASSSSQPVASLKKPTELLSEAWKLYKARWKTFLGIMIAPILLMLLTFLVFGIIALGIGLLGSFISGSSIVNIVIYLVVFILLLALFLAIIIIQFWSQVALIFAIKDSGENIGIKESYKRGWRKIKPFFWVLILSGLIVMGGYVFFVIPGIIFGIWFSFAIFIVVVEDLKGMNAILKSREYVRNYWWQVLWRGLFLAAVIISAFVVVFIIVFILASIFTLIAKPSPFLVEAVKEIFNLAGNFASIIIVPFTVAYSFLIYNDLKKIKGDFEFKPSVKAKRFFITVGVLGILAMALAAIGGIILALSA